MVDVATTSLGEIRSFITAYNPTGGLLGLPRSYGGSPASATPSLWRPTGNVPMASAPPSVWPRSTPDVIDTIHAWMDDAFPTQSQQRLGGVQPGWLAAMTLPDMAQRAKVTGKAGSFIVVGSIGGLLANTVIGAYGVSKAADHHLVRNLAAEWGPQNVRVNAIAPGLVKTDFARALWQDPKRAAERIEATPLRRLGEPRDIGGIAVFLASDAAAFITGQCIVADGGVTIL